jgi:hypothetical protein
MVLLETPMVAQASLLTLRISPLCNRTVTYAPVMTLVPSFRDSSSLAIMVAYVPALRQNTARPSGRDPTLYTTVPMGIMCIGKQLPLQAVFAARIAGSMIPPMLSSRSWGMPDR